MEIKDNAIFPAEARHHLSRRQSCSMVKKCTLFRLLINVGTHTPVNRFMLSICCCCWCFDPSIRWLCFRHTLYLPTIFAHMYMTMQKSSSLPHVIFSLDTVITRCLLSNSHNSSNMRFTLLTRFEATTVPLATRVWSANQLHLVTYLFKYSAPINCNQWHPIMETWSQFARPIDRSVVR